MKTLLMLLLALPVSAEPAAWVWLPPASFMRWSELDKVLRDRSSLKLTIALSPSMATPLAKSALSPWLAEGRVDLAARLEGDPFLPLAAGHPEAPRPQDAVEQAGEARQDLSEKLGAFPTGVVPAAGWLDGPLAAGLGASGADWLLTGPYATNDPPWAVAGRAVVIPARRLPPSPSDEWSSAGAAVYDETASTGSVFLALLADLPSEAKPDGWALASELAKANREGAVSYAQVAEWPSWDPDAAKRPPEDPAVLASWDTYGAAAKAVDRYRDSGLADLRTLEAAEGLLRRAQASRFYRVGGAAAPGAAKELRSRLSAVYRKLKQPAPDALYAAVDTASRDEEEGPAGVKTLKGPGWLELRAPAGTLALAPDASTAPAPGKAKDGGPAADPWRLKALRVEWDEREVRLVLRVGAVLTGARAPRYAIHVDLNRVLGAGRSGLLQTRGPAVASRDAWELAFLLADGRAALYRAGGGAEPEEAASFPLTLEPAKGELRLSVPRESLRGSPNRWGWTVTATAEGAGLLGVLAPLDTQKGALSGANPRLQAVRVE